MACMYNIHIYIYTYAYIIVCCNDLEPSDHDDHGCRPLKEASDDVEDKEEIVSSRYESFAASVSVGFSEWLDD